MGSEPSPVVRPALTAGLLPTNYQLQGQTSTPGAGRAGNELSPLGWPPDWAVYGGGWVLPSGSVNGPATGTISIASCSIIVMADGAMGESQPDFLLQLYSAFSARFLILLDCICLHCFGSVYQIFFFFMISCNVLNLLALWPY